VGWFARAQDDAAAQDSAGLATASGEQLEADSPDGRLTLAIRARLSDPEAVLSLVAEAESEFPESWHAAEWSKHKVDAFLATGDSRSARIEVERLMHTQNGSPWALEADRALRAEPRQASR